ncbi:MAG: PrsW family intramembrane metalloprotease [Ignavibacteria bacterium]|jgi:RsiW-degrading membrane proteinase PrsW (M82 family)
MNPFIHLAAAGFFSVIPMLFYLILIWLMDRYEREPFWLLSLNFLWGATGAIMFGIIGSMIMDVGISQFIYQFANKSDAIELHNLAGAVVVAPMVEESTKGAFLLLTALSRNFDGPVDGAVYGGAVGLGFGMTENFLYFLSFPKSYESLLFLIIVRTFFSAILHCCTQATLGAAIGFAKFRGLLAKFTIIPLGLAAAMFLHFTWNLTVSFESTAVLGFIFMIVVIIIIFTIFQFGVYREGRIILQELSEETNYGIIPKEHLKYIPYTTRRFKRGWLQGRINQRDYVKTATKLALRKHQYRTIKSAGLKKSYLREIDNLRNKIANMLYYAQYPA